MDWKDIAMLITVGTGIGGPEARDSLAHGILFSIKSHRPKKIIFFGSEESKKTIESVTRQFKEMGIDFEYDDFVLINNVDSFSEYFSAFKLKILELKDEYEIIIDYTSGTKTMTMSAAFASMVFGKKLIFVTGKRENGSVIKGTEKISSQNLFLVYDELMISKIKELFNINRFEAGKALLNDIVDENNEKAIYSKLFDIYNYFDSVDYENADKLFTQEFNSILINKWPELKKDFIQNKIALQTMVQKENPEKGFKEHKNRCYYILASLLNNARRRCEEHKYDDAIARLYRSFELIAQIRLKKQYNLYSSKIDIDILKKRKVDDEYIEILKRSKNDKGNIRLGLYQDYELLSYLNDDLGKFFNDNFGEISNCIEFRNKSILAHGLNNQDLESYKKFEKLVLNAANILIKDLDDYLNQTKFPYLK